MKSFCKIVVSLLLMSAAFLAIAMVGWQTDSLAKEEAGAKKVFFWDFEKVDVGALPPGWKVEATGQYGPLATWQVQLDPSAPSGKKVLALSSTNHHSGSTFNLCWTDMVPFVDGSISVALRPISGRIDRGGGIMWRVQDKDNYYVARFNPLEDNFRIYYVKNGHRMMINSARVRLGPGWHTMKIVQRGDEYKCFLDGKLYLEGRDSHFEKEGGVGLWTKADAVTSFDNFKVVLER
ncbi:MAG: hypothetical protein GXO58_03420 [Thermodesulfobacteria bacterium]|nr:hypothetical protein [Thermodesulfobacteriota bacterium]